MVYTIGEMARKLNVAPSTLRYYDKEGLLPFVKRREGGSRVFKDSDLEWLAVIQCLKETGMSIREIKSFIDWCVEGDATIEKRLALIRQQREAVEEKLRQLSQTLDTLHYKEWYYEKAREAGTCAALERLQAEDVPSEFRHIWARGHGEWEKQQDLSEN